MAAFKLGMRLSAALISKKVGLVEAVSPIDTKDISTVDARKFLHIVALLIWPKIKLLLKVHPRANFNSCFCVSQKSQNPTV